MPTLIVLRHAKSAWPDGVPDHERPLGKRGRRDAPAAGRWLRGADLVPDLAVCSTAVRTRQTWDLVAEQLGMRPPVDYAEDVYAAGPAALLDVVRHVPAATRTLLLVGHNPGVRELVLSLAGGGRDLERVAEKFPTSAVAVLAFAGRWPELAPGAAELVELAVPRGAKT